MFVIISVLIFLVSCVPVFDGYLDEVHTLSLGVSGKYSLPVSEVTSSDGSTVRLKITSTLPPWMTCTFVSTDLVSNYTISDASDLVVIDDYVYVTDDNVGVKIFNISDLKTPLMIGSHNDTSLSDSRIYVDGNYAYVAGGDVLKIINVTNKTHPSECGTYGTPGTTKTLDIFVNDPFAYITDDASGFTRLRVLDVSDKTNPLQMGSLWMYHRRVIVENENKIAYLPAFTAGFIIVNITNKISPVAIGSISNFDNIQDAFIINNTAYLADSTSGLHLVNISDPTDPKLISSLSSIGQSNHIHVLPPYAYLAGQNKIHVVDISNYEEPKLVKSYSVEGSIGGIYVRGNNIFIANKDQGLKIYRFGDLELSWTPTSDNIICANSIVVEVTAEDDSGSDSDTFTLTYNNICTDPTCNITNCSCLSSHYEGDECQYCKEFYYGDCKQYRCYDRPFKTTKCSSPYNGTCSSLDQCLCPSGYEGKLCTLYRCDGIFSSESNVCEGHGSCEGPEKCDCEAEFQGKFCGIEKTKIGLVIAIVIPATIVVMILFCCCCCWIWCCIMFPGFVLLIVVFLFREVTIDPYLERTKSQFENLKKRVKKLKGGEKEKEKEKEGEGENNDFEEVAKEMDRVPDDVNEDIDDSSGLEAEGSTTEDELNDLFDSDDIADE